MAKNSKSIETPADLARAVRQVKVEDLRKCLLRIATEAFVEDGELNRGKDLGADFIGEVCNHLDAAGLCPTED